MRKSLHHLHLGRRKKKLTFGRTAGRATLHEWKHSQGFYKKKVPGVAWARAQGGRRRKDFGVVFQQTNKKQTKNKPKNNLSPIVKGFVHVCLDLEHVGYIP